MSPLLLFPRSIPIFQLLIVPTWSAGYSNFTSYDLCIWELTPTVIFSPFLGEYRGVTKYMFCVIHYCSCGCNVHWPKHFESIRKDWQECTLRHPQYSVEAKGKIWIFNPKLKGSAFYDPSILFSWRPRPIRWWLIMEPLLSSPVVNKMTSCVRLTMYFPLRPSGSLWGNGEHFACSIPGHTFPASQGFKLATFWWQASPSMSPTCSCLIFSFGGW